MKRRILRKPFKWVLVGGLALGAYGLIEPVLKPIVVKKSVKWELGEPLSIQPSEFFSRLPSDRTPTILSDLSTIDILTEGTYSVEVQLDDRIYSIELSIKDTTSPQVTVKDVTVAIDEELVPTDFIASIEDRQATTVVFASQPSVASEHQETVTLRISDQSGNTTTVTARLMVVSDNQAPVLIETHPLYVAVGSLNPDYWVDTVITDESKLEDQLVDSSMTVLTKIGVTEVVLTVKDIHGNELNYVRPVHVVFDATAQTMISLFNDQNTLAEPYAQVVYDQLIKETMTSRQKMRAIYEYLLSMRYRNEASTDYASDTFNKIDDYAKVGFTKKQGHCFHYASMAAILLQKAGFEVTLIKGEGYSASEPDNFLLHYWVLVNLDGKVYHFDPLYEQLYNNPNKYSFFLVDDDYTYNRTHLWNRSLYPSSP
jgi:hypothetical protein